MSRRCLPMVRLTRGGDAATGWRLSVTRHAREGEVVDGLMARRDAGQRSDAGATAVEVSR